MSLFPLATPLVPHTIARSGQGLSSTTITTGGVAHTKTAWTQITPNTAADTYLLRIYVDSNFVSATNTSTLLDIAVGNLGFESVVLANLLVGYRRNAFSGSSASTGVTVFDVPIFIPAGTRVSVRIQSTLLSTAFGFAFDFYGGATLLGEPATGQAIDTIGASTATSGGTAVAVGVSGAAGSWVQFSASTPVAYRAFLISLDGNAGSNATNMAGANIALDIGVGAAAAEVSLLPASFIFAGANSTESIDMRVPQGHLLWLPNPVPAGSRLSVRGSISSGTAQSYGVALYGVR